jgi:hypothetical protein
MARGICKLSLQEKEIIESHLVAACIYKQLRDDTGGNPEPVTTDRGVALQTSRQITAPLLCAACDNDFGKKGETWLCENMYSAGGFRLHEAVLKLAPVYETED